MNASVRCRLVALVLGNLMGAFMFTREIARLSRRWLHIGRRDPGHLSIGAAVAESALSRIILGETTRAEVVQWCGPPSEERTRLGSVGHQTLFYRATRRVPHRHLRVGWLTTVSRWDEEHHEVAIELRDGRVSDVETRVRSSQSSASPGA